MVGDLIIVGIDDGNGGKNPSLILVGGDPCGVAAVRVINGGGISPVGVGIAAAVS